MLVALERFDLRIPGCRSLKQKRHVLTALTAPAANVPPQTYVPATGLGSLEAARGSSHLVDPITGTVLSGEQDIFGSAWQA